MLASPKDEAKTYDAVENDHHGREHRVPGDALAALGPGKHDRDNEPGFDHRHRDGEKDRAKRLAKLERKHFGVMDGGEHGAGEERPARTNTYVSSEGTIWNNFSATRALASKGIAQAQAGMEAWCGDDIDPFRCGEVRLCKRTPSHAIRARSFGRQLDRPTPENSFQTWNKTLQLATPPTLEGAVHRLRAGDCLRAKPMGPTRFVATGQRAARSILVLR